MVTVAVIVVIERDYRCLFIFADMFGNAAAAVVVAVGGFRMVKGFSFTPKGTIVRIIIMIIMIIIWGAGSARFSTSKRID